MCTFVMVDADHSSTACQNFKVALLCMLALGASVSAPLTVNKKIDL